MTVANGMAGDGAPRLYRFPARAVSFVGAAALSLLVFAYPYAIAATPTAVPHGWLALFMWAIAAGFVHGVGYVPVHRIWRVALGPLVAWIGMGTGLAWMILQL